MSVNPIMWRKMMGKSVFTFLLLSISPFAFSQNISGPPFIAVHGEAKMEVVPDLFPLEVTLSETSTDVAAAQHLTESLAKEYLDLADAQKIADDDVMVGNLDISPETEYDEKQEKQVFLGNTYERELKFRFHSLEGLRQFIAKAPAAKQVRLSTGNFLYSGANTAKKKLISKAVENARSTADEMAKAIGKHIVAVQTISNQGFNIRYSESSAVTLGTVTVTGTALLAPGTVALKKGKITLDQDVYIIYLLGN